MSPLSETFAAELDQQFSMLVSTEGESRDDRRAMFGGMVTSLTAEDLQMFYAIEDGVPQDETSVADLFAQMTLDVGLTQSGELAFNPDPDRTEFTQEQLRDFVGKFSDDLRSLLESALEHFLECFRKPTKKDPSGLVEARMMIYVPEEDDDG